LDVEVIAATIKISTPEHPACLGRFKEIDHKLSAGLKKIHERTHE